MTGRPKGVLVLNADELSFVIEAVREHYNIGDFPHVNPRVDALWHHLCRAAAVAVTPRGKAGSLNG